MTFLQLSVNIRLINTGLITLKGKMKKLLTLTVLTLGLNACSSFDFSRDGSNFVTTQGFDDLDIAEGFSGSSYIPKDKTKTLGVLTIADFNKNEADRDPKTFLIKREKSKFMAETLLFTSNNKDKDFFDETYMNFGVDRKNHGLSVEFSMKF